MPTIMRAIVREPGKTPAEYIEELLLPEPQTRCSADLTPDEHRRIGWNRGVRRALDLLREIDPQPT